MAKVIEQKIEKKRGRPAMDLTPFHPLLEDMEEHQMENITDATLRMRWAQRLKKAADDLGLEVTTEWDKIDTMTFRGYPIGEAPAKGRRTKASRSV